MCLTFYCLSGDASFSSQHPRSHHLLHTCFRISVSAKKEQFESRINRFCSQGFPFPFACLFISNLIQR